MNVFEKSLVALDKYLDKTPKEEIEKTLAELDKNDYEGPTLGQLFPELNVPLVSTS